MNVVETTNFKMIKGLACNFVDINHPSDSGHTVYAAFTWVQADSRLQKEHLLDGTGKTQSAGMAGQQNETSMTKCRYGDVVLFTKNGIK